MGTGMVYRVCVSRGPYERMGGPRGSKSMAIAPGRIATPTSQLYAQQQPAYCVRPLPSLLPPRSVIITRNNTSIIAGITYRPFHSQRFAEIAFCAVAQSLQVSGFGTRLMSWTKVGGGAL